MENSVLIWDCNTCKKKELVNNNKHGSNYEHGDWEPCIYCNGIARVTWDTEK